MKFEKVRPKTGSSARSERKTLTKTTDKKVFIDLNIIWSKINDEKRPDMTDIRLRMSRRPFHGVIHG
jgi:hypothetical protein